MTGRLTRHPTVLSEDDRAGLKDVLAHCPELTMAAGHFRDFGETLEGEALCSFVGAAVAA
ncbi:hypothetical protein [Streptomyces sp. Isolate_45]|uniref:hypothetical protein n=1 Tax=Streptomyces sp. Isolate_45 TaxID=2950111 RepID=UPI00248204E7|nr:hypothetical protein [Streptomyces sp. Isolate_45]MDA5286210.1 hypothetical protein [Streptomyces sp. Isolate_45]